jgi:hypothetical protein
MLNNPNIKYIAFDFHKECSKMRFERIQKLIDQIQIYLNQNKY